MHVVRQRTDSPWRACAADGHPCPVCEIQRSKTPLAAQIKNLCSEYPRHPLNPRLKSLAAARAALGYCVTSVAISKSQRSRVSAGLLMFRSKGGTLEVLLVHPGGPFFARKDEGAWTIPKGEAAPDEELLTRAQIEFEEELGIRPHGNWIELGSIKQKGGKTVDAWAFEGDLPDSFKLKSNTFELEWPPRSGKLKAFPEIDRAEFFTEDIARRKMNPAQIPFIDRLRAALQGAAVS